MMTLLFWRDAAIVVGLLLAVISLTNWVLGAA